MRRFIERALERVDRMDAESIRSLIRGLSDESDLYDMVMDSMPEGVFVLDQAGQILLINKQAARLLPLASGELPGQPVWAVVDDPDIGDFLEESLSTQERVFERDFTLDRGDNRIVSFTIVPLVRDREIQGSLVIVEEATEKRRQEARLRRAESLAALTTLTAGVAHEIKNPLASIGIHLQLMQKALRDRESVETEDIRQYVEIVGEEVDRLNMIVVDYLMAVRPTDTELEQGDLNALIAELTTFMQFEIKEAGVELIEEFSEIPRIEMDEKSLKQALLNLIKNAMAAMPNGGRLWIGTSSTGDRVQLQIGDTGTGIPEGIIEKIFEPYFTTKDNSSGLGLTVVYKIIKEHRGEIAVSSREGEGTTFTLSFPVPQREKRLIGYEGEVSSEV
jgi:PAS domain S-box-containing protein